MTIRSKIFRVFPNDPAPPFVDRAEGLYIYTKSGRKLFDMTAGGPHASILGYAHPKVNAAVEKQLKRFGHMDYKIWSDENTEKLAELLLSRAEHGLDRVYFAGNSGAEACEAAMKISFQANHDSGYPDKKWFISREQSYHGMTSDALVLSERPNLEFYRPMLSPYRTQIPMHHPLYLQQAGETLDNYAKRGAKELEDKILEIGPENVSGFVGETIMGGLVGDVPPAPNYWKYIREVCNRYNVHLILDEVYCGTGTSGKIYCCDWDQITPDFIFVGKTLAAGYGALNAVITSSKIEDAIKNGQGRLQHTSTYQAHSLGVAAALAVQKIIHDHEFLNHVRVLGNYMRQTLKEELGQHPYFRDVRGRGLRFSLEYQCKNKHEFGQKLEKMMVDKYNIYMSAKWHRVSFTPALIITMEEVDIVLTAFIKTFKNVASK